MSTDMKAYTDMLKDLKDVPPQKGLAPYVWGPIPENAPKGKQVLRGLCRSCMQGDCTTKVFLEDGIVVKIEGDPDMPPNYGSLCPRGNAEIMSIYNPYRIKAPLIRTNPDKSLEADPGWKEVSWEEAINATVEGLRKIREKDPRGLILAEGWGNRDTILRQAWSHAFGTPNEIGSHGSTCTVHYATGIVQSNFPISIVDLEYCRYHITLGRTVGPNFATSSGTRKFAKAIARGMKLVVVDPRSSYEAAKGEWVPIRPGTDLAFMLSLAHVMMHEGLKRDEWFLKNRTNSPYLIGKDGHYLRDPKTNKPMMWDCAENKAKPYSADFQDIAIEGEFEVDGVKYPTAYTLIKEEFKKYTPEWAEEKTTVPAATTRRIAREFVDHACIGETITIDGFTFPFRPVSINTERNVTNHRGGTYADLVGKIINMMVGSIEVPGGCLANGYRGPTLRPTEDGTVTPGNEGIPGPWNWPPIYADGREFFPHRHTSAHVAVQSIHNPKLLHLPYEIEGWFNLGANNIRHIAQPDTFVEAFRKMKFSVSIAYHMDEPTWLCDVILPEHCALERERAAIFWPQHQSSSNEVAGLQMVQIREPVPHVFNTWHVDDILQELAARLGFLLGEGGLYDIMNNSEDFIIRDHGLNLKEPHKLPLDHRLTMEEIYDRQLRSWNYSGGKGWEDLKKEGAFVTWLGASSFYNYKYMPDNQTRHPFYYHTLMEVGERLHGNLKEQNIPFPGVPNDEYIFDLYKPIPHWIPNSETNGPEEGFDMWAMNWKTPYISSDVSNVIANPWLAEIYSRDPYVAVICLNTQSAERRGIKDGELIEVESRYGKIDGRARVSDLFHPEAVGISGSSGLGAAGANPLMRIGPNFNTLLPIEIHTVDAISCGQEIAPAVRIRKK